MVKEDVTLTGDDFKKLSKKIKQANARMDRDERTVPITPLAPAADQAEVKGPAAAGAEEDTGPDAVKANEDADAESGMNSPRSSTSSATLLADQVFSDDEDDEVSEPQLTDPGALPRAEDTNYAEFHYRAHVALASASMRSFIAYYLQGQDLNSVLAQLPDWMGCGTFFSVVPNYHGEALTDVALCTLSFPLIGDDVQPTRDTQHFV